MTDTFDWWPDWSGHSCVVIASGPSAKDADLLIAKGRAKVIVVNNSWKLAPWSDVLYACDFSWWRANKGVPEFKGLKVSQDRKCQRAYPDIRFVNCVRSYDNGDRIIPTKGSVGWGRNGGFQALNLAANFGAKKIVLVGFDMRIDLGLHWHGRHPTGLHNPNSGQVERWRKALDGAKESLDRMGVTVINASAVSALKAYPIVPIEHAL